MKLMISKFPGKCADCGEKINKGEMIGFDGQAHHKACVKGKTFEIKEKVNPLVDYEYEDRLID